MKGLTMNEFYESLYCGADIDFSYNGLFYHINAGIDSNNVYELLRMNIPDILTSNNRIAAKYTINHFRIVTTELMNF